MTTYDVELRGCAPTPLARYLKALGIFRVVAIAEQADPRAQGWWRHDTFWLRSTLDRDALTAFFLNDYQPTPLVAPWNGGSGFFPKDNQRALEAIVSGDAPAFAPYREVIATCQKLLADLSLTEKPKDDDKPRLLQVCRNHLPDSALDWLDAAYVLTADGPKYPPLLGTGGNDGRLEFTNNYMQHLLSILSPVKEASCPESPERLRESLFGELSSVRQSGTIGQFDPGNLGGFNNGTGFDGASTVNAWDFVLMLEGALTFAASSVKKLETAGPGSLAYPFAVRSAGVGYESSSDADEETARSEMWLPLWRSRAAFAAISTLFSEGRADVGRRKARDGVDFARAIASLGVDRGIDEFQRYGFHQRNGLAYLAVPLGRFTVRSQPRVEELLAPLDRWLERFRRAAKSGPARAGRALRRLENAILQLCQPTEANKSRQVQALLIALGEAEMAVAVSPQLREGDKGPGLSPVPLLSQRWLLQAYDGSCEFRLAAALASISHKSIGPFRRHLEPIDVEKLTAKPRQLRAAWAATADDPALVWGGGNLVRNLNAVLSRRITEQFKTGKESNVSDLRAPLRGRCFASLGDIAAFISNRLDFGRLEALLKGLMLVDFAASQGDHAALRSEADRLARAESLTPTEQGLLSFIHGYLPYNPEDSRSFANAMKAIDEWEKRASVPDAVYTLLKLCHLPHAFEKKSIRLDPQISRRAMAGDAPGATELAARRLLVSDLPPAVRGIHCGPEQLLRSMAAVMFPISKTSIKRLADSILDHSKRDKPDKEAETIAIAP